jgi:hypothetical protein
VAGLPSSVVETARMITSRISEKVTIYLGRFLTEKCELPDHRGDPAYKSWAEESEKYEESIAPILKEIRGTNTSP